MSLRTPLLATLSMAALAAACTARPPPESSSSPPPPAADASGDELIVNVAALAEMRALLEELPA